MWDRDRADSTKLLRSERAVACGAQRIILTYNYSLFPAPGTFVDLRGFDLLSNSGGMNPLLPVLYPHVSHEADNQYGRNDDKYKEEDQNCSEHLQSLCRYPVIQR